MATKSVFSVQRIALLGLLTALCYVSRVIFQFLPNVQPVTVILIILVLKMTVVDSWIVAILSILISNIQLGMGVWTIAQILSFSILVGITGLLIKPFINQIPFVVMVLYAGLTGYLYGFIISAVQAPFFGIQNFWAYYLAGLPFDTMHALGNAAFYVLLAPVLGSILDRFDVKNRF
ncbi:ECF transporter S component [Pisciglobus halotolerans]|uniref:Energy-coupling factor transport system substrate-specific component n=1 Tax=Pisciglobus halotolerans TaxID=745365 RepID=A0A1I3C7D9_9LACT|nr:ECF transporter S component [Pisciglobus halotolerans]SFH69971.1 hypothetical protein SAMN04489868_1149 [Pisciglobus halotolerans]